MSTTYDGKRVLLGSGIALAAVLAGVTGGFWWFLCTFTIGGDVDRESYQISGLGLVLWTISTLVMGIAVGLHFRPPLWSLMVLALSVVGLTAGAVSQLVAATSAQPSGSWDFTARELWLLPASPTSWPLVVFAMVALVETLRARRSPVPRTRPAR